MLWVDPSYEPIQLTFDPVAMLRDAIKHRLTEEQQRFVEKYTYVHIGGPGYILWTLFGHGGKLKELNEIGWPEKIIGALLQIAYDSIPTCEKCGKKSKPTPLPARRVRPALPKPKLARCDHCRAKLPRTAGRFTGDAGGSYKDRD